MFSSAGVLVSFKTLRRCEVDREVRPLLIFVKLASIIYLCEHTNIRIISLKISGTLFDKHSSWSNSTQNTTLRV